MKRLALLVLLSAFCALLTAQQTRGATQTPDMQVTADDIVVTQRFDEEGRRIGVDLFVRKKSGIQSVLLAETTKDSEGQEANYAYRAAEWNATNGDEIRLLDGRVLDSESAVQPYLVHCGHKRDARGVLPDFYSEHTVLRLSVDPSRLRKH